LRRWAHLLDCDSVFVVPALPRLAGPANDRYPTRAFANFESIRRKRTNAHNDRERKGDFRRLVHHGFPPGFTHPMRAAHRFVAARRGKVQRPPPARSRAMRTAGYLWRGDGLAPKALGAWESWDDQRTFDAEATSAALCHKRTREGPQFAGSGLDFFSGRQF
jgi:hypothetical protein